MEMRVDEDGLAKHFQVALRLDQSAELGTTFVSTVSRSPNQLLGSRINTILSRWSPPEHYCDVLLLI